MKATQNRSAGYALLIERYRLRASPNWYTYAVSTTGTLRSTTRDGKVESFTLRLIDPETGRGIIWSLPLSKTIPTWASRQLFSTWLRWVKLRTRSPQSLPGNTHAKPGFCFQAGSGCWRFKMRLVYVFIEAP